MKLVTSVQTAYTVEKKPSTDDVDNDIREAMRIYLLDDLGLNENLSIDRSNQELLRKVPKYVVRTLIENGISLKGQQVLDLGCGLGGMSEELLLNGALLTALEPGKSWAKLAARRLNRHGKQYCLIEGYGESIPLKSESVDLIVSLQVLEHVKDPDRVLAEAYRVLRPGGYFYLACENYLAFREGHYQVPWLPLLPKSIGSAYLRALGRSDRFLNEAVTYITFPGVIGKCKSLGFERVRDQEISNGLQSKIGIKWGLLRLTARLTSGRGPFWIDMARNVFKFGISEIFLKPPAVIRCAQ